MIPDWVDQFNYHEWRRILRHQLYFDRSGLSDYSAKPLKNGFDMHEGIVSRAVVPASISWHWMIYHPVNCFLLTREEHIPQPPSREWAIKKAVARYGATAVNEWFYGLPWKVVPFRLGIE